MEFDLDGVVLRVATVALAPVVADGVGKDVSVLAEAGRDDAAADLGVALETVLGILVPEVEGTVGTSGGEGAVLGVEGDGVYRVDFGDVAVGGVLLAVALEGEVEATYGLDGVMDYVVVEMLTWCPCLRRIEWRIVLRWSRRRSQSHL